jgi:hypothetical protein
VCSEEKSNAERSVHQWRCIITARFKQIDDTRIITCTILSTYDLPRILHNAPDDEIWCNTKRTLFWSTRIWILPIHRPKESHWVVAIIKLDSREIFLYDSLAGTRSAWTADVQVWMKPTLCLCTLNNFYRVSQG